MSKVLEIGLTLEDVAPRIGRLIVQLWQQEKQIQMLEARVDDLESTIPQSGTTPQEDAHA